MENAKVIAVSFPDMGGTIATANYLNRLQGIMTSSNTDQHFQGVQIWQADGKPMSGDIGKGATHATCELATRMLDYYQNIDGSSKNSNVGDIDFDSGKHFIQLAGGTNDYSSTVAATNGLDKRKGFGGYGFGGYARKSIVKKLLSIDEQSPGALVESFPEVFQECLEFAKNLVGSVKKG